VGVRVCADGGEQNKVIVAATEALPAAPHTCPWDE